MKKIILDLDTGIDDTLAMSYVLASEDAELIGITGTYGNVLLETGVANDLNLLSMFGREDIPVFKGVPPSKQRHQFRSPQQLRHLPRKERHRKRRHSHLLDAQSRRNVCCGFHYRLRTQIR